MSAATLRALKGTPKQRWKAKSRKQRMARNGRPDPVVASVGTWEGVPFVEGKSPKGKRNA
jgi:hypothetical protein